MRRIYLATCEDLPSGTQDDQLLASAFRRNGFEVQFQIWSDPNVAWAEAEAVIIRSTWDYHRRLPQFLDWAERVGTKLYNPTDVVRNNVSKKYLLRLEEGGVEIIPSLFTRDVNEAESCAAGHINKNGFVIVKPEVSATADLTFKLDELSEFRSLSAAILRRCDLLIQPFEPSIVDDGEVSLIYFSGGSTFVYSHAVLKTAQRGDFRVQSDFGGVVEALKPPDDLVQLGFRALAVMGFESLFARVDIVDWRRSPKIGEIELIEPALFFSHSNGGPDLFVESAIERFRLRS